MAIRPMTNNESNTNENKYETCRGISREGISREEINRHFEKREAARIRKINLDKINRTEKRYIVTHKVYDISGINIQDLYNSTVKCILSDDEYYPHTHKLSDIAYINGNKLYVKPVKELRTIYNDVLFKNRWVALLIHDIKTNTNKLFSRDDIMHSDILNYSYNASYINNKTSVRVNVITDKDIDEINKKVANNIEKYNERNKRLQEKHNKLEIERQKRDNARLRNIEAGKKIFELMTIIDKSDVLSNDAIEINNNRYLRYENGYSDRDEQGYMRIYADNFRNEMVFRGFFLDEDYELDYQQYITLEVEKKIIQDLDNLNGIIKSSSCDDAGYMNDYLIKTNNNYYRIRMCLDAYDGIVYIETDNEDAEYFVKDNFLKSISVKNRVNNKGIIDTLIRIHKLCKEIEYCRNNHKIPNTQLFKTIMDYVDSTEGEQQRDEILRMLNSVYFKNKVYYNILINKIFK